MSYDIREVKETVGLLLQYSCLDEAFHDMSSDFIDGKSHYNGVGEKCRQLLIELRTILIQTLFRMGVRVDV